MKTKATLLFIAIISFTTVKAQVQKGDRTLAWQIDLAENNNYDSSFAYAKAACLESVHFFFTWANLEPDTGNYDAVTIANFLDVADIYYPANNMKLELQIAPLNTGVIETPSELSSTPFNSPVMINQFKRLLDTVFAHIPNVELTALNIGNESDVNLGTNTTAYAEFKTFLDSVSAYAKQKYFNLHSEDLKVGTTFTFHGLTNTATSALCQGVNASRDIISVTYYPLNNDFTMKPPSVVSTDFSDLVSIYSDTLKPIYFVECGYASSTVCNSSEAQQADFYSAIFDAWDTHYANIKYITFFKTTDWSQAQVDILGTYYNINDTVFLEYLRTLGVRTWDGDGSNKQAYERILCELDARGWCSTNCTTTEIKAEGNTEKYFQLYPNPAKSEVWIKSPMNSQVCLFSSSGKIVFQQNIFTGNNRIDISNIPAGFYFAELHNSNQTEIIKVSIQ